jgi:hypothetical protein
MAMDFKDLAAALRVQGWTVDKLSSGHFRAQPPDPTKSLVHFSTGSDPRSIKNTIADLRRAGFVWPPPEKRVDDDRPSGNGMPSDEEIEAEARRRGGAYASPAAPASEARPTPENPEEKMDRCYRELKEARGYFDLAEAHLAEKDAALAAATRERAGALEEKERAQSRLVTAKTAFDAAFAADGKAA